MKLTLKMYQMDRFEQYKQEWTKEIENNANVLIAKINALLLDIGYKGKVQVTSGWRPAAVNAGVGNAAKKSAHMTGEACDLLDDKNQSLCKLITVEMLKKHGLYMEHPEATVGKNTNWTHLQTRPTKSGNRIFKP